MAKVLLVQVCPIDRVYAISEPALWAGNRLPIYADVCVLMYCGLTLVGSALRHNPFAPFVPCHRVIASNLYIGGFFGEWGTLSSRKDGASGQKCQRKIEILAMEGVEFTVDGYLADDNLVWSG